MVVNEEESSFIAYTLEWSRAINRGEISDETFHLFRVIEIDMQKCLLSTLSKQVRWPEAIHYWCWHWCTICMGQPIIKEEEHAIHLLKAIIGFFFIASSWIEQYKRATNKFPQKKSGYAKTYRSNPKLVLLIIKHCLLTLHYVFICTEYLFLFSSLVLSTKSLAVCLLLRQLPRAGSRAKDLWTRRDTVFSFCSRVLIPTTTSP